MRDDPHSRAVRAAEERLRALQAERDELERHRAYERMMRDSWHDQWRRDAGARAIAEERLAEAERLLAQACDLLAAWAACHDDPGLARRGDQLAERREHLRDGPL